MVKPLEVQNTLKYWFQSRRPSSAAMEAVVRFRQRVISGPCWGQAAMHLDISNELDANGYTLDATLSYSPYQSTQPILMTHLCNNPWH